MGLKQPVDGRFGREYRDQSPHSVTVGCNCVTYDGLQSKFMHVHGAVVWNRTLLSKPYGSSHGLVDNKEHCSLKSHPVLCSFISLANEQHFLILTIILHGPNIHHN